MPHFIIDCSENIIEQESPEAIMQAVYDIAEATGFLQWMTLKFGFVLISISNWGKAKEISFTFLHTLWKAEAPNKKRTSQAG